MSISCQLHGNLEEVDLVEIKKKTKTCVLLIMFMVMNVTRPDEFTIRGFLCVIVGLSELTHVVT